MHVRLCCILINILIGFLKFGLERKSTKIEFSILSLFFRAPAFIIKNKSGHNILFLVSYKGF